LTVDLGGSKSIIDIAPWNRTDNAPTVPARLTNFYVFVSNNPFDTSLTPAQQVAKAGVWSSHQISQAGAPTTVAVKADGRYVMVQLAGTNYLSLAEVQVFGSSIFSTGQPATQSSDLQPGITVAARADDGNTNCDFNAGSVSHTNSDLYAWWNVDLGGPQVITNVAVWNNCNNPDRLTDYWVFVSNSPFNTNLTPDQQRTQPGVWSSHQFGQAGGPTTIPVNARGSYVMLQLPGKNYLELAEVQVLGA